MIEPTVGRQVWYLPSAEDKAGPGGMVCMHQPLAATIVCVLPAGRVNLMVLDAEGTARRRLNTPFLQTPPGAGETSDRMTGYAVWPTIATRPPGG